MADASAEAGRGPLRLPAAPDIEWLRKQAKKRLQELRASTPDAKLADAQLALARTYGFASWRALKAHIDGFTIDGQLFEAAKAGDATRLALLLDEHPEKLGARSQPYAMTLLHLAARHLAAVELLLARGIDVNARDEGDNTHAMHWAAAAGEVEVVRRLIQAGGDVIGRGDDHELEVIGWATCWDRCDDDAHHAVVDLLLAHGARHHIFSAIAMGLEGEVRRIVREESGALSRRMSRNEDHQLPLHFAVRMNLPAMVSLLLEIGADPLGADGSGQLAPAYALSPAVDRPLMEGLRALALAELDSARRGNRDPNVRLMDLAAALSLGDWPLAARLWEGVGKGAAAGRHADVLALMSKRGDLRAVEWLLAHGADPDARWNHWGAVVTPLHMAVMGNHPDVVRALRGAGADPTIHDSEHDGDARDWARFFGRAELLRLLDAPVPPFRAP
jgi:ankyrin repeat protein